MKITASSTAGEITPLALAIHEIASGLPVTMRTKNVPGVRIEDGEVIDDNYTGPILEKVLVDGKKSRETPKTGPYTGMPVLVVPLKEEGEVICVIGVVDITKGIYSDIMHITRRPGEIKPEMSKGEFY
ncbi:DUF2111 domain-containing protein [Methanobacterium aggregans]|uniref:DUF2111 domain-containing protein n=1 Tax=Methanobacterium aggregans TaxID=1615586 RepID=UPI001AE834D4|nr:DUF2111 domain-containing protein [Methanobacterium aggregans]MBP2044799.1 hypothetical protein [Methanobacterium aggregans]